MLEIVFVAAEIEIDVMLFEQHSPVSLQNAVVGGRAVAEQGMVVPQQMTHGRLRGLDSLRSSQMICWFHCIAVRFG